MNRCEVCGNEYKEIFEVKFPKDGISHWFDSFECATYKLAPRCGQCGVRILGHGLQAGDQFFCGAHCARLKGVDTLVDHAPAKLVTA